MIQLLTHQGKGATWLSQSPRALLAWDMGTGKTYTAIAAWHQTVSPKPLLIVCLASAKRMWAKAVQDYCGHVSVSIHGDKKCDFGATVVVTNYERLHDPALRRMYGAVIFDEAHRLKNRQARCTKAAYGPDGVVQTADHVWLLSGTIMPSHPGELYTHAKALFGYPHSYGTWERTFCVTREAQWGTQVVAGKNLDKLHEQLDRFIHRLRRDEVLTLPPLTIDVWPLDAGKCGSAAALRQLREQYDLGSETGVDALLAAVNSNDTLAQIRRETAVIKATATARMLNEEDDARKTLIFCHHHDAIDTLSRELKSTPMVLTGKTPVHMRQMIVDNFQRREGPRYFIGQIQAAGASLNLQSAQRVVFCEASWVPGDNAQAIARAYRHGQTNPVNVRYAYLPGSIDEVVTEVLARKARMAFFTEGLQ